VANGDEGFTVDVVHLDGDATVRLTGEIDLAAKEKVLVVALPTVSAGQPLIVDMEGVTFLDSSGIACLLILRDAASAIDASLVVNPSERVRTSLSLAGLTVLLGEDDSEQT
jgi:anti-sigma B factor antagonist